MVPFEGARIVMDVGGPLRLTRLENLSHKPHARLADHAARALDQLFEDGLRHMPCLGMAEDARRLVELEVATAFPALHFADGLNDVAKRLSHTFRIGKAARYPVLQAQHLLGPALLFAQSQIRQAESDIAGELLEQRELPGIERIGLAGKYAEHSDHIVAGDEREPRSGAVPARDELAAPRREVGVGLNLAGRLWLALAYCDPRRSLSGCAGTPGNPGSG